jgi:C4-type Zn-finger protein
MDRSRGWNLRRDVKLECPKCRQTLDVPRDETDPPRTARVVTLCPECVGGDFSTANYFDAQGREIDLDGKPMKGAE